MFEFLETTMGQITTNFGPGPNITGAHPAIPSPSPLETNKLSNFLHPVIIYNGYRRSTPRKVITRLLCPILENNANRSTSPLSLPPLLFRALIYENKKEKKGKKKEIPSAHRVIHHRQR